MALRARPGTYEHPAHPWRHRPVVMGSGRAGFTRAPE
jgi:hypothetical protein